MARQHTHHACWSSVCLGKTHRGRTNTGVVLEPSLPDAFRAIHRELAGLSIRFQKSYLDMRLWGFKAAPGPLLMLSGTVVIH